MDLKLNGLKSTEDKAGSQINSKKRVDLRAGDLN